MKVCIRCKTPRPDSDFKTKLNGRVNACCNPCLDLTREMAPVVPARIRLQKPTSQPTPEELEKTAAQKESEIAYRIAYRKSGKATFGKYKTRAAKKELPFELTFEQFLSLLDQNCHYCHAAPRGGIDRKDSALGYTVKNSLPCCKRCNLAKNDMSYEEFLNHIRSIYDFILTKVQPA
jgi:hypothetical protein